MPTATQGLGQQYGDVHVGGQSVLEIVKWEFEPVQKLGKVVTNATGGFEGQVQGAISGKGSITVLVPKTGYSAPIVAGANTTLNLYADAAKLHGFTNVPRSFRVRPRQDRTQFGKRHRDYRQFPQQWPL